MIPGFRAELILSGYGASITADYEAINDTDESVYCYDSCGSVESGFVCCCPRGTHCVTDEKGNCECKKLDETLPSDL